jgi:Fe-S-cluster-containing hydrogenase component 2
MAEKVLKVEERLCTGCGICELRCSLKHLGHIQPSKSRIRIFRDHHTLINTPQVCLQCTNRFCIDACPAKIQALSLDQDTEAVLVDTENCIGCGKCVEACPYDGIHLLVAEKKVVLCDLCGGDPECVKHCPEGVLSYAAREGGTI